MRSSRRWAGAVLAAGIVVALLPLRSAVAFGPADGSGQRATTVGLSLATGPSDRTVTLITGDRVEVANRAGRLRPVRIEPGPGRTNVVFTTNQAGGRLRVTPSDALPLLRADRLDPRLFDVTGLVDAGYDDRRADLPLMATGSGGPGLRAADAVRPVHTPKKELGSFWRSLSAPRIRTVDQSKIWLDALRKPLLTESVPQVGAPAAWAAGFTGAGVTVGLLDSGVDTTHPDLAGKVVAAKNFFEDGDTRDFTGHGTHVAATIAGIGADGLHKGVAPDAHLVSARVCGPPGCPESAILAGMQWLADQGVKVVNMSLGGPDSLDRDPLEDAVDRISAQSGVLFVIAAGNDGELGDGTVATPGSADAALTVGAVTKQDDLADFSSRGPRLGDGALKPDITAPGVNIVAAQSRDAIDRDPTVERVAKSGTSMATPHVTGAAAILLQQHPDWTRAQLKSVLMGSARTNPEIAVYAQGAGRLDVARAVRQTVLADPPSVSVQDQWPLEPKPIARTVTYRNTGTAPVTLALALHTTAPAGMFTLSAKTVTVPAGGTAGVRLDIRTTVPGVAPNDTGYLVATAGDTVVTTPFVAAVETEPTFQVSVNHIDRDGGPAQDALSALVDIDREQSVEFPSGAGPRRLPKGRYAVLTLFRTADNSTLTLLVKPLLMVDRDLNITMDARTARPVSVRLPQSDAEALATSAFTTASGPTGVIYSIFGPGRGFDHFLLGPADPGPANPAVESGFSALLGKRGTAPEDSPYLAHVAWRERGRMFPGLDRTVAPGDLATVRAEFAHHALATGTTAYTALWPDGTFPLTERAPVRLPSTRVEYFNTDGGVQRQVVLTEGNPFTGLGNALVSPVRTFTGGRTYEERRNAAVYGPGFTDPPLFDNGSVLRMGDTMRLRPTLLDDALNWGGFATSGQRAHLTLDRDGTRVFDRSGNAFDVPVPAGAATYRLGVDLTRTGPQMALSTRVTCAWTFHSGTTADDRWTPLPLSAVRFLPPLDLENAAPAGTRVTVPFEIQRQPGSAAAAVRDVHVQVSFDDGTTWQPAQVLRHDQRGVVLVNQPAGPGFVSLRASAVDAAGNTVDETILRAYRTA